MPLPKIGLMTFGDARTLPSHAITRRSDISKAFQLTFVPIRKWLDQEKKSMSRLTN